MMNSLTISQNPTAAFDPVTFLDNARAYLGTFGTGLIALMGLALVVWGGFSLAKKLMAGQQNSQGPGWVKIALMILIGGAMLGGGLTMLLSVAEGGQTTIEDLGGGGASGQFG